MQTEEPREDDRLVRGDAAAGPPPPSPRPRAPGARRSGLLDPEALGALGGDLALGNLLERDREGLVAQSGLDERRHELGAALAELVVVGVDLPRALGREGHQCVLGVDLRQEVVDLRLDHGCGDPSCVPSAFWFPAAASLTWRNAPMIAATSADAASTSSFTTA